MSYTVYLERQIQSRSVPAYQWDDWDCRKLFLKDPPDQYLAEMSDAAALALLLGTAEWINVRFSELHKDRTIKAAIDCGWAYMAEIGAGNYFKLEDQDWNGPVEVPLLFTATIIADALFFRADNPEIRSRTFWMANLARYVLEADAPTFDAWFNQIATRLMQLHPRSEMPKLGLFDVPERFQPVVGRLVLDPDSDYNPATARSELLEYLFAGARDNPFITYAALTP
jgi:hypothetical protein